MRNVIFFLISFGIFAISVVGGQINSDPAPGRSPGPPNNDFSTIIHHQDNHNSNNNKLKNINSHEILLHKIDNNLHKINIDDSGKKVNEENDQEDDEAVVEDEGKIYEDTIQPQQNNMEKNFNELSVTGVVHDFSDEFSNVEKIDGFDENGEQKSEYTFTTDDNGDSKSSSCINQLFHYLEANDRIVNLNDNNDYHPADHDGSGSHNDEEFVNFHLKFDITHDLFDTQKGLSCGLMYKVQLWTNLSAPTVIENFFIETVTKDKDRGNFISDFSSNKLALSWFRSPFTSAENAAENYHKIISWDVDSNENILHPVERWQERNNFLEQPNSQKNNEVVCSNNNKWNGQMNGHSEVTIFWMLNEFCDRDDSVEFRIFFRTTNRSNIVFKKRSSYKINKGCELFLKNTLGFFDYTSLPLYNIDCSIYFPSQQKQQQQQKQEEEGEGVSSTPLLLQQPPGILIELTRLNAPCDTGSYIIFSNKSKLCGKLEELSENERTYNFGINQKPNIQIHKSPLFSLKYQLVDYCYNMTLKNQSDSFYIQLFWDTLKCFFRIHLPYGYKIELNLITNNASDLYQSDNFINEATTTYDEHSNININNNNNTKANLSSQINFSSSNININNNNSNNSNNNNNNDNSRSEYHEETCDSGMLIIVRETNSDKWSHCVHENSEMKRFSIISQTNTLELYVLIKTETSSSSPSLPSLSSSSSSPSSSSSSSSLQMNSSSPITSVNNKFSDNSLRTEENEMKMARKLPSLYFTYNAIPIMEIVSDCAFGWVAVQQFCVSRIEKPMSWHQGEQYCANNGGHLASIRSDAEQKIIDQLLLNGPGYEDRNAYWIGASDKNFEGDFRWTDGTPFQYTNWFPGWSQHGHYNKQPNDDGLSSQDCIELRRYFRTPPGIQPTIEPLSSTFMWNDRNCNAKNYLICKRPMGKDPVQENWTNDCNKTVSLTKEQSKTSLWSPSFPRQYPDNANCFTTVTAPSGYRIVLEFEELVIENESGCSYDYLEITEPSINHSATSTGTGNTKNIDPTLSKTSRHSNLRKNTYRKRNSYENLSVNINNNNNNNNNNLETVNTNYQNLLNIFSNMYKPRSNYLIQTPDYPRGKLFYQTNKIRNNLSRRICGDWSSKLKLLRYVSNGSYLGLHFASDYSHHFGGYKAKVYMENTASECSDERLKPYNGSCYLFVSYPEVEWWTAQQICRGLGAQLSSISSPDEHRFITTSIRNQIDYSPQIIYWLGGELNTNGEFEWTDGTKMNFQGWLPGQGQFDHMPTEAICLGLQWKMSPTPMLPSGIYWEAQKCRRMGGYICKKLQQTLDRFDLKNETIRGLEGRLISHGYPNHYPLNIDYWVHIVVPERNRIIVQFQKIDLEAQDECLYDYVSIQNYETTSKILLEPGENPIPMAMLTSDEKIYNNDDAEFQYEKNFRTKYSRQIRSVNDFDVRNEQQFRKKQIKFEKFTETNRFEEKRILLKQNNPKKVKQQKLWKINYNNWHKFNKRSTENLIVDNAQSFLPYVRWCGSHDSNMSKFDFVSASNEVMLNFHSDYSVSGLGFAAIWKAIDISGCPIQTLTSREGIVSSPNYPNFLINNLDCTYIIQAPLGGKVWVEFKDFEILEDSYLTLDIGEKIFRPFQNKNQINEGMFVSLKEQIRIHIKTGQKPRGKGFQATFKTVGPFINERVIYLNSNSTGQLLPLNYPQMISGKIDFIQHLVAPLGEIILLELHGVEFTQNGCFDNNTLEIFDNYADKNGTRWQLCKYQNQSSLDNVTFRKYYQQAPVYITSYLNTIHIRQKTVKDSRISLNATIRVQQDVNYKLKLALGDDLVESCQPNPCQFNGKCMMNKNEKRCQCQGHFTGRFCGLTMCELEPCLFGKCELTSTNFKCHCQAGYVGTTCEQKQKPCADNPCEGRGECFEKNGGFFCRCHAWWEGHRCERRMMHIPYKPLSERMLQEPFWLGLITVFVVLAIIGLVWCAKRHFPEKIEKLLAEEADRNRPPGAIHGHHHHTSLREQLQFTSAIPQGTAITPGAPRSIFNRLGIRKPSILSLSSPNPPGGATARTFSLDDLLRPPPRRSPSPRKKRNNSTPTKKNAAEKKQILQQLVSPAPSQLKPKLSLGELIQMSENRMKANNIDSESDQKETTFSENSVTGSTSTTRILADPKFEKKVTFARLLSKVSAEMSSGSEVDVGNGTQNASALSLPAEIQFRGNSLPQSPCTNDIRSPHSISSNHGSESLSSSEIALSDISMKNINNRRIKSKVSSADSILAMFRSFGSTTLASGTSVTPTSVFVSPSTTPSASSPQDDAPGDDDSSTSSMITPVSFSSGAPDSPVFYRQTTIEVPVLDALSAHKTSSNASLLHPPTILLEIPSNGINKCLSPIRELPTPIPSPALTPIMPRPNRSNSPIIQDDPLCGSYSDDEDKLIRIKFNTDINRLDSEVETTPTDATTTSVADINKSHNLKITDSPMISVMIDIEPPTPEEKTPRPKDLIIPTLMVEQPSPTRSNFPKIIFPGSPPPQRASIGETSSMFPNKQQQKRLLKQFEKPTSLDLPFVPPTITVTSNVSEIESDAEPLSPIPKKIQGTTQLIAPVNPSSMCYLSPFAICTRADRTISESNLSSSGYSSMASPGPSRCGSNNPLCPNEMDESGGGHSSGNLPLHASLLSRRQSHHVLASCKENVTNGNSSPGTSDNHKHIRGRSDSETLSDEALLESNDEGIGTDHLDEKIEDNSETKGAKQLELIIEKDLVESGKNILNSDEVITMSQLQLPSIVVQTDGIDRGLSPVSSRSESPLSERTGMGQFSPHFFGRKDLQLPFTDSDGLYDFPSSDGKGASITHQRRSSKKRGERKTSKIFPVQSPTRNHQTDSANKNLNIPNLHNCTKHHHHYHHPHHGTTATTRKSPKRRPVQRHPVASSSSSTESITSAREITLRTTKRIDSPFLEKHSNECPEASDDDTGEDVSSQILPNAQSDVARPRKISRLKTMGNQIRFLRRLEQSIKNREKVISPSDSCPEDGNEDINNSSRTTSPLLQSAFKAKSKLPLCRQKRLPSTTVYYSSSTLTGSDKSWRGRGKHKSGEINSD